MQKTVQNPTVAVAALREHFNTGITKSKTWRIKQLTSLDTLLRLQAKDFERALHEDLGKAAAEAQLSEIAIVRAEIKHALKNLGNWMAPKKVRTPKIYAPARAWQVAEPLGVTLIIAPWNYPVQLSLTPLVGALAAGNTVAIKPSELAPATSALIAQTIPATLDPEAVKVFEGAAEETGRLLNCRFDHIFYTGSGRVGKIVAHAAAANLTPVTLELGGKSPLYIDETAPLKDAALRIAWAKFMNAGQTCVAPDYVLATAATLDKLQKELVHAIKKLYKNPAQDYGRIVNEAQFDRLRNYLNDGALVTGGGHNRETLHIEPTIMRVTSHDTPLMREEIFGPILPLVEVRSLEEAIHFVQNREKPLAAYVFSENPAVHEKWQTETSSGSLAVNVALMQVSIPRLPFGGVGASGTGSYHGKASFNTFSHQKSVFAKPLKPDTVAATVMPPYTRTKYALIKKLLARM